MTKYRIRLYRAWNYYGSPIFGFIVQRKGWIFWHADCYYYQTLTAAQTRLEELKEMETSS